jgi:uncharacterized phage-associated protein
MAITIQNVDREKLLEAILYIASRVYAPTFHKISKMFWYADKLHLERYGFIVSEDTYHAMKNGPVPSHIYNMMKYAAGKEDIPASDKFRAVRTSMSIKNDGWTVVPMREPNMDFLSESEIECFEDAMREHGHKSFSQLSDETHDSAWKSVDRNAPIPFSEIVKTLPNAIEIENLLCA